MVRVRVTSNEISPEGDLVEHLAAAFEVRGQDVLITEGDERHVQLGLSVYSDLYGRQIEFDTDGEEWARNLPNAYRNGAIFAEAETVAHESGSAQDASAAERLVMRQALAAE
jgi:hypothetical protein